ncbi:MAG: DEAD/DEAH box helicase [Bacteroidales bacterium]|nr:DEAD/DEAH box helicase [Bacteroidales bacterium]
MGYENPTPVQEQTIPIILEGKDIIVSAQTGTGKTAAFLLPVLSKIITDPHEELIKAMVVVPTRELAIQINQHMEGLSYFTSVSSIAVYGGGDGSLYAREKQALTSGIDVAICTPGRLIAHLNMGYMNLAGLKYFILDEADRMLDMGFNDDIIKILSFLPKKRQSLLFSATFPKKIRELARQMLVNPAEINISLSKPPEKIAQLAYVVYDNQKIPLIKDILQHKNLKSVLIFCSTKISAKQLSRELKTSGFAIMDIHSDLDQKNREEVLTDFKNRKLNILVATDILSRGIDIDDIELVVNFDVPHDGEDYIHRIGRTARAESNGEAITLITDKDQYKFLKIEKLLDSTVPKGQVPEYLGAAPAYDPKARSDQKFNHFRKGKPSSKTRNKKPFHKPRKK